MSSFAVSRASSSTSESPTGYPCALKKVFAIPPPINTASALFNRFRMTPILSLIFAPPKIATKGSSGLAIALT